MPQFPGAGTGASLVSLPVVGTGYTESGPGWSWDPGSSQVDITGDGAAFSGYRVLGGLLVKGSGVTVSGCSFTATAAVQPCQGTTISNCVITISGGGGTEGIQLQNGSQGTTIQGCTISGADSYANRAGYAIVADTADPQLLIEGCDIYWMRVGIVPPTAGAYTIQGCYLHDPGFCPGDHSEPVYCGNGTATGLISGNAILSQLSQTAAVFIANAEGVTANITVEGNLLAGGGYAVYGGGGSSQYGPATGITVSGNYFSTMYWPQGGYYGPVADWSAAGNTWSGNTWHDGPDAGQPVAA